jgi:hypothetical protein
MRGMIEQKHGINPGPRQAGATGGLCNGGDTTPPGVLPAS